MASTYNSKQSIRRRNYKKTSQNVPIQLPVGFYGRKAHVPITGTDYDTIRSCVRHKLYVFALPLNSKVPFHKSSGHSDAVNNINSFPGKWFWKFDDDTNRFNYGFAVATGKRSNLTVIDSDGNTGEQSISIIEEIVGMSFPKTVTVNTPNGGKHRYYKYTPLLTNGSDSHNTKIDVRNNGGHVVAPTSQMIKTHPKGFRFDIYTGELIDNLALSVRKFESYDVYYAVEYELGVLLRRNYPVLHFAFRHFVFFRVRKTVIRLHFGAISSSTTFLASSRSVQALCPSGG